MLTLFPLNKVVGVLIVCLMPISNMQINCLLPAPCAEEKHVCRKQISALPSPTASGPWCLVACISPQKWTRRNPEVCLPSGVPLMSVGGPVLTVRLGFWVRAFCRVQSKLSILSCTKPQIFSSSKRQVLSAGKDTECCFSDLLLGLPCCFRRVFSTGEQPPASGGGWKGIFSWWLQLKNG